MVVREGRVDGASQASMHSQRATTTTMVTSGAGRSAEEDDSDSSSDPYQTPHTSQRKRKTDDMDDEKEVKRRKNREAAKRCRDKKQQQTDDLKRKNGELEKENCDLAKQRDELIRKCRDYQREIEQHKQQGCVVPHFNPPYDLDHLLQPSSPPSPSFSESAPSTSSCPSPAPSVSPGPPPKYLPSARNEFSHQQLLQEGTPGGINGQARGVPRGVRSSTMTAMPTSSSMATVPANPDKRLHYLRVRNKDGSHNILCLDHENYLKVKERLNAQRLAAAKTAQSELMQASTPGASLITDGTQSQQEPLPQEHQAPQYNHNAGLIQTSGFPLKEEEQEESPKPGQKLDTCEDLISILKTHIYGSEKGFELTPVNEEEVAIKQEPLDAEYERTNVPILDRQLCSTRIKQDEVMMPESSGTWTSTGQQIRTSLDTLTNPDDLTSPNAQIQNIVQYLEGGEQTVPVTPYTGASTVQQPAQTTGNTVTTRVSPARPAQTAMYVTSSASVGALSKMNAGSGSVSLPQENVRWQASNQTAGQRQNAGHQGRQQNFLTSTMQTVKLRPHAAGLMTSAAMTSGEDVPGVASSASMSQGAGQGAPTGNGVHSSVTTSRSMAAETALKMMPTMSASAAPVLTMGDSRMRMTSGQLSTASSLTAPQQHPALSLTRPITSTIDSTVIAPLHLQDVTATGNLLSTSTSQIAEYLKASSIETMDS